MQAKVLKYMLNFLGLGLLGFTLTGCSYLFWWDNNEEPNEPVSLKQQSVQPSNTLQEQDKFVSEVELPESATSSASEAIDEVMNPTIELKGTDYLEGLGRLWVSANKVNVRSGPSFRYERVRTLNKGARINILERRGNWVRIEANQWVSASYLTTRP